MIKIFDNFLSESLANEIEKKLVYNNKFNWYYQSATCLELEGDAIDTPQMTHLFYDNNRRTKKDVVSEHWHLIEKIMKDVYVKYGFKESYIQRVKANCTFQTHNKIKYSKPHNDFNYKHSVIIYYISDSDGDTFFFDNDKNIIKQVSPKKNRAIYFDGDILHAGSNPVKNFSRFVLNINMTKDSFR